MKKLTPHLQVLRVYEVPGHDTELREDLRQLYIRGNAYADVPGSVLAYIDRCIPVALLEVLVDGADDRFSLGHFTQEMESAPEEAWQVPYDEALLSADGLKVIARRQECAAGLQFGRVAFYLHFFDPAKPLQWTYGEVSCPPVEPVPPEIMTLLPYHPLD